MTRRHARVRRGVVALVIEPEQFAEIVGLAEREIESGRIVGLIVKRPDGTEVRAVPRQGQGFTCPECKKPNLIRSLGGDAELN